MRLINDDCIVSCGELANLIENGAELLQRCDNDISAVIQALQEIFGVGVNVLGDTLLPVHVLELSAKLTVNDCAVTDDYNRIDVRGVDESLGKPSDCFGLTAACTVPDQIPATHAIFQHILLTAENGAKLMKTGEYHIAFIINKHKLTDDTQQHITL